MPVDITPFWTFTERLRRERPYERLDILTTLKHARDQRVPVTNDDVRRLVASYRNQEAITLSEKFISDFVSEYLRAQRARSLLDPLAEVGGLIAPVAQTLKLERAIGLTGNQRETDLARLINPDAPVEWLVGDANQLLSRLDGPFEAIISCLRPGTPVLKDQIAGQAGSLTLHDEADRIVAARALRLLSPKGVAMFVLTNSFLWQARAESLNARLNELGVFLNAVVRIPRGAFAPAATLPALLAILTHEPPEQVFIGELNAETAQSGALFNNLLARKEGRIPHLGVLVKAPFDTTVEAVVAEWHIQRESRELGLPSTFISDLALEVNMLDSHSTTGFAHRVNSVYIPTIGKSQVVSSTEEFTLKPHNYAQIVLAPDMADAAYVARFLNTSLGRHIRESLTSGGAIPHLTKTALAGMRLYVPTLDAQTRIVSAQNRLTNLRTEMGQLMRDLDAHPQSIATVERAVGQWEEVNGPDSVSWYEALPYPLASILWEYHATDSTEHRVQHLLHFFEAFAEYVVTILLSGYASDLVAYDHYCRRWLTDDPKYFESHKRADFGYWVTLGRHITKTTRQLLDDKMQSRQILDLFDQEDSDFIAVLSSKDLFNSLDTVRQWRNEWSGHGGLARLTHHQTRLQTLEAELAKVHRLLSDSHATTHLVSPGAGILSNGVHSYTVTMLMGTHAVLPSAKVETISSMDTSFLYLLR